MESGGARYMTNMKLLKEFKEFAIRGNAIDLAIGIIIGAAFNKIVNSLVDDVLMPPIGLLIGRVNFDSLFVSLGEREYRSIAEAKQAGAATINYGLFLSNVISFLILAFVIFLVVRQINRLQRRADEADLPMIRSCPFCISTISSRAQRCPQCTSEIAPTL